MMDDKKLNDEKFREETRKNKTQATLAHGILSIMTKPKPIPANESEEDRILREKNEDEAQKLKEGFEEQLQMYELVEKLLDMSDNK